LFIIALDISSNYFNVKNMKDKIKEFRDKNPELDFAAGFIPGVGEAQDAHDFVHAAKKRDIAGMSWALLGLALPGLAGG
jgi:hypothetical protein